MSSQSVSESTFFQAKRSHCLSSSFAIKFPNPSGTMSACAPHFSLQGFPGFFCWSHILVPLCSKL